MYICSWVDAHYKGFPMKSKRANDIMIFLIISAIAAGIIQGIPDVVSCF
jgi:hypothetical protein